MAIPSNPVFPLTGRIDLFTMRGPQQPNTNVEFDLVMKRAQPLMLATMPADRRFFDTRTTGYNQVPRIMIGHVLYVHKIIITYLHRLRFL